MPEHDPWSLLLAPDDILFDSFNLEREELRTVHEAREAQDWPTARSEFFNYFRCQTRLPFEAPTAIVASRETRHSTPGDEALKNIVVVDGHRAQLPDPLDWCRIPLRVHGWSEDRVTTQVNQHDLMRQLAQAYVETGNPAYARHAVDLMMGWLRQVGAYPRAKYVSDHRAAIFANPAQCRRPRNWSYVFFATLHSDAVTDGERIAIIKLLLREVAWMRDNFQGDPHDCIATYFRLLEFADWWPELHNHDKFMQFALNGLFLCLDDFMYADGAYVELCNYEALGLYLDAIDIAQRHNVPLPMDYMEKSVRLFNEFLAMIIKPDGTVPALNDAVSSEQSAVSSLLTRAAALFADDHLKWLTTGGEVGREPGECSKHFPYAGLFVMRNRWSRSVDSPLTTQHSALDKDAMYMILDGGRNLGGEQHAHMDKLSFELYAFGRTLITDSGCAGVVPDRLRNEYFVATPGHNTILVDGCWQAQYLPENLEPDQHWHAPHSPAFAGNVWLPDPCMAWHAITWRPLEDNSWTSTEGFDFAAAAYDQGYTRDPMSLSEERVGVRHARAVFFIKSDYFIIWDALEGEAGAHKVESLLHFPADAAVTGQVSDVRCQVPGESGDAVLRLSAASLRPMHIDIIRGQLEPTIQGWVAGADGHVVPAPCVVISADSHLPLDLFTVLHPFRTGEEETVSATALDFGLYATSDVILSDRAAGVEVQVGARRDLFVFSTHPAMPYTTRDSHGDEWSIAARACCVRLDEEGQVANIHAIGAQVIRRNEEVILSGGSLESLDVEYEIGQVTVNKRGWGSFSLASFDRTMALVNGDPITISPGQKEFEIN